MTNLSGGCRVGLVFLKLCPVPVDVERVDTLPWSCPPVGTWRYSDRFVFTPSEVVPDNDGDADAGNYDNEDDCDTLDDDNVYNNNNKAVILQADDGTDDKTMFLPASLGVFPQIVAQDSSLFPQSLLTAIT